MKVVKKAFSEVTFLAAHVCVARVRKLELKCVVKCCRCSMGTFPDEWHVSKLVRA